MTLLESFILGLVQGLTEFLPVSSSAHLVFFQHLFGFREQMVSFDVVLHLGTLLALFIYFAGDVAHLIRDSVYGIFFLIRRKPMQEIVEIAPHSKWALGILVASIPTALMGILLKDWFEAQFDSLQLAGYTLFGTTLLLWLTRYFQRNEKGIDQSRYLDFLVIGLSQGISISPGISRSGATIAAALFLGLRREEAFRFSFLLSIPAILGAAVVELQHGAMDWAGQGSGPVIGFLAAAVSGYLSLHFLSRVTRQGKLHWFAIYTFLFGVLVLILSSRFE